MDNLSLLMARRKKRMARKDKTLAVPLPSEETNNKYVVEHMDYSMDEYTNVTECWIDIEGSDIRQHSDDSQDVGSH